MASTKSPRPSPSEEPADRATGDPASADPATADPASVGTASVDPAGAAASDLPGPHHRRASGSGEADGWPLLEFGGRHAATGDHGVLHVTWLADDRLEEADGIEALAAARDRPGAIVWADLTGATAAGVEAITHELGLHELIAEDILEGNQRAKIALTDDLIHLVMFVLRFDERIELSEVDIVLGEGFLLTVHNADWDPLSVPALRAGAASVMARGPDHLLWALVDSIVDGYFPFIDRLGDAIEEVQDAVIASPDTETLSRLIELKSRLLVVRRAATPVREIFNQLTNRDLALIDDDEILYFRDVYDHLIRLTDELDNYRELVSGTLDVYLSTINNQLSLIMKRLTGVTVVLTGIAAIAGIFGMSEAGAAFRGGEA
ncbi:MAG TPA: magnesium transporter CorA family protein, partial [Candidatus Binatia bacterium]|nr:magnesium transporter CorA family protein [Candidatus Binatia bacterium]